MAKIILIRHGETDYNLENRYCGFSDPPLNSKGVWQSKKLAACLKNVKADKVYSSDLKRAYETAKIIFKSGFVERVADFREMNFGIFEGLKYKEIIEKYPNLYKNWIDNLEKIKIPKGEALKDLNKRIRRRLYSILSQYTDERIALIIHGGPIRIILCDALRFGLEMFWQIDQGIAALNIIDYPKNSLPIVVKMNDTSHLSVEEPVAI